MVRAGWALGIGAAVLGGAALGFVAERALVRGRFVPPLPPVDVPFGSIEGETSLVEGPGGLRVLVESYGPVDAPQVVLSHGWICTGRVWHEQVVRLADRYRIITYDQPGHGRTPAPPTGHYDLDLLGDTLIAVVADATRPGPLVIAGHSMGGMALLNAARRAPLTVGDRLAGAMLLSTTSSAQAEKLTLELGIRAAARLERGIRRLVPTLRDPRILKVTGRLTAATSDLSYLASRWTAVGPTADPRIVAFTQQLALDSGPDVVLGLIEAVLGVREDEGLDALAGVPTSIVVGTYDKLTPLALSRRMADRASHAEFIELEGVGHMSLLEAPDRIVGLLEEHLARAGGGAGTHDATPVGDATAAG